MCGVLRCIYHFCRHRDDDITVVSLIGQLINSPHDTYAFDALQRNNGGYKKGLFWSLLLSASIVTDRTVMRKTVLRPEAKEGSDRSDDPPPSGAKSHFSADCLSANILNMVRLRNRINKIE